MKRKFLLSLFVFYSYSIIAQINSQQVTGVLDNVPYVIKTQGSLLSFNNLDTIKVQEGRLALYHFNRNMGQILDQLLQIQEPDIVYNHFKIALVENINYIHFGKDFPRYSNRRDLLLDTSLLSGNNLNVVWLDQKSELIQKMVFQCVNLKPKIWGFRTFSGFDSSNQVYKSRRLSAENKLPKGYVNFLGDLIKIKTEGNFELLIKKPNLVKDSTLQFRFFDQSTAPKAKWVTTGHLITLKDVTPGNSYFLEIKYIGHNDSCLIEILTDKEIYQEGWFLAILFVFVCLLSIWVVKWYYKRRIASLIAQRNRVEDKLKMVQSQLNPHFVFNALSSIEGLISNGENELANQYLANFSTILRETLKNSDRLLISLEEEISLIDKYCKVEQLRFGFNYNLSIDQSINVTSIEVPPLLIQPIIENAVKHGLAGLKAKGYLEIMLQRDVNDLVIIIKNNHTVIKTNTGTAGGYGLRYLQERLDHFNLLNKGNHIVYDFELLMDSATATVRFSNWLL
ncbi:sensor histidine kinase [Sediminibacterium sp. C3]|uniref:sensor histidine kinase n=1 Tax=Sediminibacterium sp. C3 TaxID=1267211 RepID=UPI00041FDFBA|nr:histidine kinase [Sediminibacterium sp. C3]